MKYRMFEESIEEICSRDEIEKYFNNLRYFKKEPLHILQKFNAEEFAQFYVISTLMAEHYKLSNARFKLENIDGKEQIDQNIKTEYEKLYKNARDYSFVKRMIERVSVSLEIANAKIGNMTVMEASKKIVLAIKEKNDDSSSNDKIDYLLKYIEEIDSQLGLNK